MRVTDSDGAVGWGEIASPSGPFYAADTTDTCWHVTTEYLIPALLEHRWEHPEQVPAAWSNLRGHQFAKAGVDMACWALWAQAREISLAEALGGTREHVVAGVSLGIEPTMQALLDHVAMHVDSGYPRVKLKIAPGFDVAAVRAVREAFPNLDLYVDANGAYTEQPEHLRTLRELDEFGLLMIEQPFAPSNFTAHARLQAELHTPLCLDESVVDVHDLDTALALGACRVLNIKASRMGGLTAAVAAHHHAQRHDVAVWCGGMHEFGVGRAANVALSSLRGFVLPSDVSGSDKYYARDVVIPPIRADRGRVRVPRDHPGLGHEVDEDFVRAISATTATFTGT